MTNLFVLPDVVANAAVKIAGIGSEVDAATAAAAGPTTNVVAAAGDEVSTAAANIFNSVGQQLQQAFKKVSAVNQEITQGLGNANAAYLGVESSASKSLGALGAAAQSLLSGSSTGKSPAADIGLIMGGSGLPIPSTEPGYLPGVLNYVNQNFSLAVADAQSLFTPEGLYPLTGVKSLPLNMSVTQGAAILEQSINAQISPTTSVTVLGNSQSAIISSIVMEQYMSGQWQLPAGVPTSQLTFTLLGNEMNPNGGALERFVGIDLVSLGIQGYGATPPNTPFQTNIYTLEYDGAADFPQYPIDIFSDLNAVLGIQYVHGTYPSINPSSLPPGDTLITLPGSGIANTNYYMITQPNLPLLEPLREIPVIGNPLADLMQPDLSVLVNLGYGSTTEGWSPGPANVPTPFGVIPPVPLSDIASALAAGAPQGMNAFMSDINLEAPAVAYNMSPAGMTSMLSSAGTGTAAGLAPLAATLSSPDSFIQTLQAGNTAIAGDISGGLANAYAIALPAADIANALAIAMPSYDANVFLIGVQLTFAGDPVDGLIYAFGGPVAADTGIVTLAAGFELDAILDAV